VVTLTDEARTCIGWSDALNTFPLGILNPANCDDDNYLANWAYVSIRAYNDFLKNIETASVSADYKKQRSAEVRYLRAWAYFSMAIRYGGIPLIKEPQALDDDLKVSRNKEDEIYEFVRTELNDIIAILPESNTGANQWRVNKYVALALKSRAMLHAASIAKYGTEKLNGLVGVPASKATQYFQESYDASKLILAAVPTRYSLYNKYADKVKNYQYLFLEENNSEIIFCKKFVPFDKGHNLDIDWQPILYKSTIASIVNPTLEMIDEYEFADGTPGSTINYNQLIYTKTLYKNKEPRFHASILYNKCYWVDDTISTHYFTVQNSLADTRKKTAAFIGKHVNDREAGATQTGFLIKKFLNEKRGMVAGDSGQDFIIFRLGEIYLNLAEAAFQLGGKDPEALAALNTIRNRAGVPNKTAITMKVIKHERKIELAFEGFRMWDARRWREATTAFSGVFHKLTAYFITSKGTYGYLIENCQGTAVRVFREEHYYNPIAQERIFENSNLLQNPGYN
jgi:hypothetical protein